MCGIVCVLCVSAGASTLRPAVLERAKRLRHRGPDWGGVYCEGAHILAHERLSIVGVSSGAQPMQSFCKNFLLAANGEIYNHQEIRASLEKKPNSMSFTTTSDCEVIYHLFADSSISPFSWLNSLNGIFAFVALDREKQRFFIARDHMGIIPLYMGRDACGSLWVTSELKALADVCVEFEEFPPGHFLDSSGSAVPQRWYQPRWLEVDYKPEQQNSADLLIKLRSRLESAVSRQLMSEVPYGVLLSGGLDSSLIAAIAAGICGRGVLHSFSIGLEESPDLRWARQVAAHLGTIHHEIIFTVAEGLDAISDVIYQLETYDVTTIRAATPMYLMSRRIRQLGIKMVLSGEGSDEIFAGYLYFHKAPNAAELQAELVRKLQFLYKFDCLRANKATASWGVEARVPFLDKEFLDFAMGEISPVEKLCGRAAPTPERKIEKFFLRKAFEGVLPEAVLWRQKEQFSDGVGYSWIDSIKAEAERSVSDLHFAAAQFRFPHNPPATKEAFWIRSTFERHFPQPSASQCVPGGPSVACSSAAAIAWDSSFRQLADCSGRSVAGVHESAWDAGRREILANQGGIVSEQEK